MKMQLFSRQELWATAGGAGLALAPLARPAQGFFHSRRVFSAEQAALQLTHGSCGSFVMRATHFQGGFGDRLSGYISPMCATFWKEKHAAFLGDFFLFFFWFYSQILNLLTGIKCTSTHVLHTRTHIRTHTHSPQHCWAWRTPLIT